MPEYIRERHKVWRHLRDLLRVFNNIGKIQEAEDYIFIKNITSDIAQILNCSRQNVDSIIRRGDSNKIRELDYIALQYIEKMYGE